MTETVLVTQGGARCLLGSSAAKCLQVLKVVPELANMTTVYSVDRFPKVFSGVGNLFGYQLKLHIDCEVTNSSTETEAGTLPIER